MIIVSYINDGEIFRTSFREGANDYLTKPFDPRELAAKVDRLIAKLPAPTPISIRVDPINFDVLGGDDFKGKLTQWEFQILMAVHNARTARIRRSELMARPS